MFKFEIEDKTTILRLLRRFKEKEFRILSYDLQKEGGKNHIYVEVEVAYEG